MHNSKTTRPNFTIFLCMLSVAGPPLAHCYTLCISGFVDDVIFSYHETCRQKSDNLAPIKFLTYTSVKGQTSPNNTTFDLGISTFSLVPAMHARTAGRSCFLSCCMDIFAILIFSQFWGFVF